MCLTSLPNRGAVRAPGGVRSLSLQGGPLLAKRPRGYRDSVTRVYAGRIVASGVLIAATTLIIALLEPVAPVISLGALYIVAVLAAAVLWGLLFAVGVSTVSLLVFNWVFLPPVHTFALEDPANWAALLVYLSTAVVTSELAARMRRRAAEAERRERDAVLLADLSARLLERGDLGELVARVDGRPILRRYVWGRRWLLSLRLRRSGTGSSGRRWRPRRSGGRMQSRRR